MRKKHEIDDNEKSLFRSAIRGVKPLAQTKILPHHTPPRKPVKKKSMQVTEENEEGIFFYESENYVEVGGDDLIEFHRGGLQHKVLRKLRQGKYNVEAILDLHGMRVTEASDSLNAFLLHCLKNDVRHVLIIHGKGHGTTKPVLKNKLNQWLRQIDTVLAFCSATLQDGRSGAVYVLLKGSTQIDE